MNTINNFSYSEITIGQTATYSKTLTDQDIKLFAATSGDVNPVHLDEEFAANSLFKQRIAHGMWTGGLISAALAMKLPGPGTIYLNQNLSFRAPVFLGDTITVTLTVTEKNDEKSWVTLNCEAKNQHDKIVAKGEAQVIAPKENMTVTMQELPPISFAE